MHRRKGVIVTLVSAVVSLAFTSSVNAYTVNFGCSTDGRTIAATAVYSAAGATQWHVDRIDYEYSNSGGGESNTSFSVYNGAGAAVWAWDTPDDRRNQAYTKSVDENIARGSNARARQQTWFDVFGNDPSCTESGHF
jgi:hypothetical protein